LQYWTHKDNEPPLTFAGAELGFMIWLYNLRITYPSLEIYIADDDISGAFRLMRYHPNCMAGVLDSSGERLAPPLQHARG
jgi:hypothetical protein